MELRRTIKVARISHEARELLDSGESVEAQFKVEKAFRCRAPAPF